MNTQKSGTSFRKTPMALSPSTGQKTHAFVQVTPKEAQALKSLGDRQQKLFQTDSGEFVLDTIGSMYANGEHDRLTNWMQNAGATLAFATIGAGAPVGVPLMMAGSRMERNNADQVSIYVDILVGGKKREEALGHLQQKMDILGDV